MKEIYFVTDVETTGHVPGFCSMLTIGCAAEPMAGEKLVVGPPLKFYERLTYDFNEDGVDEDTLNWWCKVAEGSESGRAASFEAFQAQPRVSGAVAMARLLAFVFNILEANRNADGFLPRAIFVARPAGFDRAFVNYYFKKHAPLLPNPFEKHSLDVKSLELGLGMFSDSTWGPTFGRSYEALSDIDSTEFERSIGINPDEHTHNALDDATHLAKVLRFLLSGEAPALKLKNIGDFPTSGTFSGISRSNTIPTEDTSVGLTLEILKKSANAMAEEMGGVPIYPEVIYSVTAGESKVIVSSEPFGPQLVRSSEKIEVLALLTFPDFKITLPKLPILFDDSEYLKEPKDDTED